MPGKRSRWPGYLLLVVVGTAGLFAYRLDQEPFFADESAHIAQTYYYRLLKAGDVDHVNWVHVAAYDHTPIYKYWIGAYLDLAGDDTSIPTSTQAWERWMSGQFDPPRSVKALRDARLSMLLAAVLGCVLIFILGWQIVGVRTGFLAAVFLAASPLYYTHARRAMADDLTQAFVMAAFVGFVWMAQMLSSASRGRWPVAILAAVLTGIAAGLAAATKLNGITALASIVLFALVTVVSRFGGRTAGTFSFWSLGGMSVVVVVTAAASFLGSNPYFYAQPAVIMDADGRIADIPRNPAMGAEMTRVADLGVIGRMQNLLEHRTESLEESMPRFAEYALPTVGARAQAIVVEGIGRWSFAGRLPPRALGITIGCLAAGTGFIYLLIVGRQQRSKGGIPIAWLLALWPTVEILMLVKSLMLDWDRYYMGVVTWTAFLAAVGIGGVIHAATRRLILPPPGSEVA